MENNIRSKNIKFNLLTDDKVIIDYFDTHKDNFSKVAKTLLLEYVTNAKDNSSRSIIDVLEEHTKLLQQIVRGDALVSSDKTSSNLNIDKIKSKENTEENEIKKSSKKEDKSNFNMEFLEQLK